VLLALGAEPPPGDADGRALVVTAADGAFESSAAGVSGHVPWVPADRVDLLIVLHETRAQVLAAPFELERLHGSGLRAAGASAIQLREHPIAHCVADPARTSAALGRARLYVAASLVGVLRQACEYSRRYALDRVAFGRPIAHHQALAFLIVDLHSAVSGARLLLHDAAFRADHGLPFAAAAASAFAEAVEASRSIGPGCVQILGGHGFMQDHPVEKYMRESRVLGLMLGGIDLAREHAGRALCEAPLPFELSALEEGA
jgi:alkylation response protein AidB-like acyl-CoA dehydrogenase